ncbi:MAG: prepilin-type N-terminal cleavage/methylation domain-containing protein [Deltaproteobacteria bacterium]|nr:prepilin-type N-terminal cleavage/methylation domain-containing protein [Deltaproteobacteria bacterium]MCB9785184.1 prepilin-type N-terminal cleavage/methylation domain-containing protein [Deltaproteobacteria bacterium]
MPRRRSGQAGFTLIELAVTLTILVLVIGLVTMSIANIRRADLKASGGMLAAAMRYTYNLAVINGTPYRLVLDLNEGAFWGEELQTDDPCARYLPEEGELTGDGQDGDEDEDRPRRSPAAAEAGAVGPDGQPLPARDETARAMGYQRKKDNLLSKRTLPKGIKITGVITSHHSAEQTDGKVAIHFFPGGFAEKAWVWLGEQGNPEEDAKPEMTLALDGLMGHVSRSSTPLDPADFIKELE